MRFTAAQIAMMIDATVEGDASASVDSFGKIEEAKEGQLAFLANPKYEEYIYTTNASIVLVNNSLELKQEVPTTLLRVPDAYSAFATLLKKYEEIASLQLVGIQDPSFIAKSAKLGENVFVAAFAYISENVVIGNNVKIYSGVVLGNNVIVGDNSVLHPGVKIYHDCVLGKNVTIHAGTVVGSDGFGFAPLTDGTYKKIPQIGNVIVEDDVEIGANTTIDRATMGSTIIKKGAKLDNLIQIGHNAEVGGDTVIAAQVGVSGSSKIGSNVMIGGQAGITGHISIADGTKINGKSGVSKTIKNQNTAITGNPAEDFMKMKRIEAIYRNLPELEKRVRELEKKLNS